MAAQWRPALLPALAWVVASAARTHTVLDAQTANGTEELKRAEELPDSDWLFAPDATTDPQMYDLYRFWNTFRDPENGLYCDAIYLDTTVVCGPRNDFYSLASVGMGLVAECIFAEIGLLPKAAAEERALQSITTVAASWPRENGKGFFQHFTDRSWGAKAEYSTIDTAIGALGALFAGNYFGGQVKEKAEELARLTKWTAGIKGSEPPAATARGTVPSSCAPHIAWGQSSGRSDPGYKTAYARKMHLISGVDLDQATDKDFQRMYKCLSLNAPDCNDQGLDFPTTCSKPPCNTCLESTMFLSASLSGEMEEGILKPFNEYYMLAYLATKPDLNSPTATSTNLELAARYFEVFFGTSSPPLGDGDFPKYVSHNGFQIVSDQDNFIPSFHVQFDYFLTAAFGKSTFYLEQFKATMEADMDFWERTIPASNDLHGKVWGSGAGLAPAGYEANSISKNHDLTFSAPIMAGFLTADPAKTATVLGQLRHMYSNDICTYRKPLPDYTDTRYAPKIIWRCSITQPNWRATRVESVDFSTMVFGFAQHFLPAGFYQRYAA